MQALTTLSFSGASGVSAVAKLLVFFQVGAFQSNLSFLGSLIMLSYADVHADNTEKRLSTTRCSLFNQETECGLFLLQIFRQTLFQKNCLWLNVRWFQFIISVHHARRGAGGSLYSKAAIREAECLQRHIGSVIGKVEGVEGRVSRNGTP